MRASSHLPPEDHIELQPDSLRQPYYEQWCKHRGLSPDLVLSTGARLSKGNLVFRYTQLDGELVDRTIRTTDNKKLWVPGAKGKGAVWYPTNPSKQLGLGHRTLLLTEGESDALSAVQAGCPWDVGCLGGANMWHPTLAVRWDELEFDRVIVVFDNDNAGRHGASVIQKTPNMGIPVVLHTPPGEGSDLNSWLKTDRANLSVVAPISWDKFEESLETIPPLTPERPEHLAGRPTRFVATHFKSRVGEKPNLLEVWKRIARPLPHSASRRVKGGKMREAFCPIHDDGTKPSAWVGEHRWGCWACGIENADVYELVAWTRGVVPVGQKLSGEAFKEAKKITEELL